MAHRYAIPRVDCSVLMGALVGGLATKGWFTLCITFPFRHRSIFVPSDWSVFTLSVVFSHLPAEHVIEGQRLSPTNMQPRSFSKRQLAAITLMLDEEEKMLLWFIGRGKFPSKNTTIIWLKWWYYSRTKQKTTCFGLYRPSSGFHNCFVKESLTKKLWKPDDGRYRPKHVVFCFVLL